MLSPKYHENGIWELLQDLWKGMDYTIEPLGLAHKAIGQQNL